MARERSRRRRGGVRRAERAALRARPRRRPEGPAARLPRSASATAAAGSCARTTSPSRATAASGMIGRALSRGHGHRHPQALPGRVVRPQADRGPRPVRAAPRAHLRRADRARTSTTGKGLWFAGDVGTGKTSLAMLVSQAAERRGRSVAIYPVTRLLAEIKDTYDRDSGRLLHGPVPAAVLGGPAPARRPRRREAHRLGARAALLDRQRALAGPALDRRDHQHHSTWTSCASRSARAPCRA